MTDTPAPRADVQAGRADRRATPTIGRERRTAGSAILDPPESAHQPPENAHQMNSRACRLCRDETGEPIPQGMPRIRTMRTVIVRPGVKRVETARTGIHASCPNPTANPVGSGSALPPEGACADEPINLRSPLVPPVNWQCHRAWRGIYRQRGSRSAVPERGRRIRPGRSRQEHSFPPGMLARSPR